MAADAFSNKRQKVTNAPITQAELALPSWKEYSNLSTHNNRYGKKKGHKTGSSYYRYKISVQQYLNILLNNIILYLLFGSG